MNAYVAREYLRAADKCCHEPQPPRLIITGYILLSYYKRRYFFDEIRFVFTYRLKRFKNCTSYIHNIWLCAYRILTIFYATVINLGRYVYSIVLTVITKFDFNLITNNQIHIILLLLLLERIGVYNVSITYNKMSR